LRSSPRKRGKVSLNAYCGQIENAKLPLLASSLFGADRKGFSIRDAHALQKNRSLTNSTYKWKPTGLIWTPGEEVLYSDETSYEKEGLPHPALETEEASRALEQKESREKEEILKRAQELQWREEAQAREREEAARKHEAEAQTKAEEERVRREEEEFQSKSRSLALDGIPDGEWSLQVRLVSASHLPKMDLLGTCDAYVVLKVGSKEFKSKTVMNTYSPVFDEVFTFALDSSEDNAELTLTVFDWDKNTADDIIGHVTLPLAPIKSAHMCGTRTVELLQQGSRKHSVGHDKKTSTLILSLTAITSQSVQKLPDESAKREEDLIRTRQREEEEAKQHARREESKRLRAAEFAVAAAEEADRHEPSKESTPLYYVADAGHLHLIVQCAKGLPKMDLSTGACDAYVKVAVDGQEHQTQVIKGTKDPVWNEKVLRLHLRRRERAYVRFPREGERARPDATRHMGSCRFFWSAMAKPIIRSSAKSGIGMPSCHTKKSALYNLPSTR
jgi:hypothetical protein